jgi:branched-chain amino acid transport system ATP-binding protein
VLELRSVSARYGQVQVLWDVSLTVGEGELVCLLGGNASGKSTTIKSIIGLVHPVAGEILWEGRPIQRRTPAEVVRAGIAPVLESRRIFPDLTVHENLLMGAYTRVDTEGVRTDLERVLTLFPVLGERRRQPGGALSGGEQQMLAMGRALLARPRLLVMDEPSMGLSPLYVDRIFDIIQGLNRTASASCSSSRTPTWRCRSRRAAMCSRTGRIVLHDTAQNLVNNPMMRKAYLEL